MYFEQKSLKLHGFNFFINLKTSLIILVLENQTQSFLIYEN